MVDLLVPSGGLTIGPAFVIAPKYRLFRMEANATLHCDVDLAIRAERAEFATGCVVDARGRPGAQGQPASVNAPLQIDGGDGARGHNVSIAAGLAEVGTLEILTDGGAGGAGAAGQPGPTTGGPLGLGGPGGDGGKGGRGGDAGKIEVAWVRLAPGQSRASGVPTGHTYRASGGLGGPGGPAGPSGGANAASGRPGTAGLPGANSLVEVRWRSNLADMLWAQVQDMGPNPRWSHTLAYDPARMRTVLFGGLRSTAVGGATTAVATADTWEWNGRLWTQVADTGPLPRAGAAMAYDPVRGALLLFGGRRSDGALAGDTWAWDGDLWLQLEDSGPPARAGHAMATDPVRQRVLLFGGTTAPAPIAALAGDTWEWDGRGWLQVEDSGPSARAGAALGYSLEDEAMLLFGGSTESDTWAWKAGQWTQVADTGPSPRTGHALSNVDSGVVLFGGRELSAQGGATPALLQDTWGWAEQRWRQIQDMGPPAREGHAAVYDEANGAIVLFGGDSGTATGEGDTWELRQR